MVALPNSPYPRLQNDPPAAAEAEVSPLRRPERAADGAGAELASRIDLLLAHLHDRPAHNSSGMTSEGSAVEARIAHLEASAAHLQRDVTQIRTDVREIRDRLYRLQDRAARTPTRAFLLASIVAVLAAFAGVTAFAPELQGVAERAFAASMHRLM